MQPAITGMNVPKTKRVPNTYPKRYSALWIGIKNEMMAKAPVIYNGKLDAGYILKMYEIIPPIIKRTNTLMSIFLYCIEELSLLLTLINDDTIQVNNGMIINPHQFDIPGISPLCKM